jgi:hypothetical protein
MTESKVRIARLDSALAPFDMRSMDIQSFVTAGIRIDVVQEGEGFSAYAAPDIEDPVRRPQTAYVYQNVEVLLPVLLEASIVTGPVIHQSKRRHKRSQIAKQPIFRPLLKEVDTIEPHPPCRRFGPARQASGDGMDDVFAEGHVEGTACVLKVR